MSLLWPLSLAKMDCPQRHLLTANKSKQNGFCWALLSRFACGPCPFCWHYGVPCGFSTFFEYQIILINYTYNKWPDLNQKHTVIQDRKLWSQVNGKKTKSSSDDMSVYAVSYSTVQLAHPALPHEWRCCHRGALFKTSLHHTTVHYYWAVYATKSKVVKVKEQPNVLQYASVAHYR